MADNNVTTILQVQLDAGKVAQDLADLSRQIANVKQDQADLNAQFKNGEVSAADYNKQMNEMKDELSWLQKQQKGLIATTKLLDNETNNYSDSLNGQRQKLADMQKAYDQLDRAQRESDGGKAFLEALKAQSDAVKELEAETGRAQRNVGNYPKAWEGAIPAFDKVNKTLEGIGVSMQDLQTKGVKAFSGLGDSIKMFGKAFITPPIVIITAVLSAILLVVNKVREAFKKNDSAMTALQKAFAVFKPIGEAVAKVFEYVADGLGKVATAVAGAVSWIAGKLSPAYKQAADDAQALVQAQDDLEQAERDYTVNSAKNNAKISELKAKSVEAEKYSVSERRKMLQEAIDLEKNNLAEQKRIAAERLRILEEEAKQNADTSDETADKIAQARAAMYQADSQYYAGVRELNSQLTSFDREERSKREQAAAESARQREESRKQEEAAEKERQENARQIAQQAEDFALSLIEDETARTIAQRKIQGEREIEQLQKRLNTEKNLTEKSRDQLAQLIKDKQTALDADIERMAKEAADKRTDEELKAEQERAIRILNYKRGLAEDGSLEELELQKQLLEAQMQQELNNVELTEEEKYLIRKTYEKKIEELNNQYADNVALTAEDAKNGMVSSLKSMAGAAASAFGAISDLLGEYAEENEGAAKAQKAFAAGSILINQAMAIASGAQGIASAMAGAANAAAATGPAAPFTLIAFQAQMVGEVLAIIASVASTFVQAKQLLNQSDAGKFATGGVVGGSSYTGDRLIAHVNSGEGIYTGAQANNLLQEIANNPARGGFDYEAYAQATAAAVAAQPAPVVDYTEMQQFGQKVATYNEIASI